MGSIYLFSKESELGFVKTVCASSLLILIVHLISAPFVSHGKPIASWRSVAAIMGGWAFSSGGLD